MEEGSFGYTDRMLGLVAGTISVNFSIFIQYVSGYYYLFYLLVQWYLICSGIFMIIYSSVPHRNSDLQTRTAIRLLFSPVSAILLVHTVFFPLHNHLYSAIIIAATAAYLLEAAFDSRIYLLLRLKTKPISKISAPLVLGILSVAVYYISGLSPYTISSILVLAFSIILFSASSRFNLGKVVLYAPVIAGTIVLAASVTAATRPFLTDELLYDFLSAGIIVHGGNPYLASNLSDLLNTYGVPLSARTFLTNGQYASGFYYPALAAVTLIPSALFHIDPRYEILIFTSGILIAVYLSADGRPDENRPLIMALFLISDLGVVMSAGTSTVDPIWAFFLVMSFITRKHSRISAVLLGASLATKQLSWIFVPFYMIFTAEEKGRKAAAGYFSIALLAFVLLNMPYLALTPGKWFISMISPEMLQILGARQGLGSISFAGFLPMSRTYFMTLAVAAGIVLLAVYWLNRASLKYAIAAFPMIVMFLNYRMFINYLVFWPLISAISISEISSQPASSAAIVSRSWKLPIHSRSALKPLAIAVILIVAIGASMAPLMQDNGNDRISVSNVSVLTSAGNVTGILVKAAPTPYGNHLQFRVFPSEVDNNTYLSGSFWNLYGFNSSQSGFVYRLAPANSQQEFPAGTPFRLEIYYGSVNSFINVPG